MIARYEAVDGARALAQLEGWWRWCTRLNVRIKSIAIAPDVEPDLWAGLSPIMLRPQFEPGRLLTHYRGIRLSIDEALAPRGVQLS